MIDLNELKSLASRVRGHIVEMSHRAKAPHLGSSLSCVDILIATYWCGLFNVGPSKSHDPNRDRIILSKGHAAAALYAVLAEQGYFPVEDLQTFAKSGSALAEHPTPNTTPGVEAATGSLGHGLSLALGMAQAAKILKSKFKVLAVLSDGECNEGSVWEAAMLAPALKLNNLIAVIDYNKWQATGRSNEVMSLASLRNKWEAFGWSAYEADGHDLDAIIAFFKEASSTTNDKPSVLVAHTIKGKGVSFMEDDNNWHYRIPTADEVQKARQELGLL